MRAVISHTLKVGHLKEHINAYHLNIKFQCDWPGCEYSTGRKELLTRHMRTVHSTERNFLCDWPECGKSFKTKRYLNEHMAIHNNDKAQGLQLARVWI